MRWLPWAFVVFVAVWAVLILFFDGREEAYEPDDICDPYGDDCE